LGTTIKIFKELGYVLDKQRIDSYADRKIRHMYRFIPNNERYHIRLYNKNKITYFEIHRDENFGEKGHDIRFNDKRINKELNRIERLFIKENIGFI